MMDQATLVQEVIRMGAYRANVVSMADAVLDPVFRDMCKSNACGNYGRNWMCPPDAGDIDELMAQARGFESILVYQTVGQLEDSYDFEGMMEAAAKHNAMSLELRELFQQTGFSEMLQLGAGGCHVCKKCAKLTNEPCRYPDKAMASLETYGFNVSELARLAGMKYINGSDTVTYFGALLFNP